MNRLFTFILFFMGILLLTACSEEERSALAKQQVGVVFEMNLLDNPSLPLTDSLREHFAVNRADSLSYKAIVEICLFNDVNKVKEYTTRIHPLNASTWITDTLHIINPGVGAHILQRVMIFNEFDGGQPVYTTINNNCKERSASASPLQLPLFIEMTLETPFTHTITLPVTLFNTCRKDAAFFGYDKWPVSAGHCSPLAFVICNTKTQANMLHSSPRTTGKLILSQLVNKGSISRLNRIEEQIFVEEVKTTLTLPTNMRPDDLFEIRICIPDEIDPETTIADTLTGNQIREFRNSGFWLKDEEDADAGLILFDLSILPNKPMGLISITDSVASPNSWTPSFIKR